MISRFTASLLILIVALPFTAPFSTCDISDLMSQSTRIASRVGIGNGHPAPSIEEARTQTAGASVLEEEQFKDAILTSAAVVAAAPVHSTTTGVASVHLFVLRTPLIALRL